MIQTPGTGDVSRLTRIFVLASLAGAIALASYAASYALPSLPWLCGVAAVAGAALARLGRGRALAVVLFPIYFSPVLFLLTVGNDFYAFAVLWISALAGAIAGKSLDAPWSVPAAWRWPIVLWALTVALSWPIVAWRELDFTFPPVWDGRLPVANLRRSAPASAAWTAFVALTHLTGLLWIDWLFREYSSRDRKHFVLEIALPLAASMSIACAVGVYQGFVDISFLSGHNWPSVHRAAGTLMDGNVFGMLAALWAPAFLVLGLGRGPAGLTVAAIAFALAWGGVWTSGSRTALLAAVVGTGGALLEIPRVLPAPRLRLWIGSVAASAAALMLLIVLMPTTSVTAIERARSVLPALNWGSLLDAARSLLWERSGYGPAARAMLSEFPWTGVGVGAFNTLVYDYAREAARVFIPADNAQNWFRHQLAELGLLGSIGWAAWVATFGWSLCRRHAGTIGPGMAVRGSLIGFALASLVGMPGQDPAVVITFWTLAFWYIKDAGNEPGHPPAGRSSSRVAWAVMLVLVCAYMVGQAVPNDLRPPFRAARFGFPYFYGVYSEGPNRLWTTKHGVTVLDASQEWMRLTVWVDHPDVASNPVAVDVWRDHDRVIHESLPSHHRLVRYVRVPAGKRFVLEAKVDRTFQPSQHGQATDSRDLGLAMKWEFVPTRPK